MPVSVGMSLLIILAVALTTFATRVVPFLIFPKGKEIPPVIQYLGRVLTPAVIGLLVVYCLRQTPVMEAPHGIPEGIAVAVTALAAMVLAVTVLVVTVPMAVISSIQMKAAEILVMMIFIITKKLSADSQL